MSFPVASVVVPSRGGASRLPVLMEALKRQQIDRPWEVVVVLDGDTDGSARMLRSYETALPLRVLTRQPPHGVASALADGYAAAQGAIVIRCDDDLTPRPDFIARHLAWHQDRSSGAAPLGVIALTRDVFTDSRYARAYGRPANRRSLTAAYARSPDDRWMHWAACNSVPRSAYEAVGGFDTTMDYREDSELGLRLARSGVEMVIDPALEIEHRCPAPDTETRAARAFTSGASTRAFEDRHPDLAASSPRSVGVWNRLVSLQERTVHSRTDAARLGRRIDTVLPFAPDVVRGKLIALAVEASAGAGRRDGSTTWVRSEG